MSDNSFEEVFLKYCYNTPVKIFFNASYLKTQNVYY